MSEEARATLPPRGDLDFDRDRREAWSVDWGAPGDARHAWKGKFFTD